MKGKYLNPKADLTFKKVFGEHPDLVMSLLNALLPLEEGKQIEHVEYLTPEMVPENPGKKGRSQRIARSLKANDVATVIIAKTTGLTSRRNSKTLTKQIINL